MKFARMLEQLSRSFLFYGLFGFGVGAGLIEGIGRLVDATILHDLALVLLYLMPIPCVVAILLGWAARRFRKAAIRSILATGERAEAIIRKVFIDVGNSSETTHLWLEVRPPERPHFQAQTELCTGVARPQWKPGDAVDVMYDPDSNEVALLHYHRQ